MEGEEEKRDGRGRKENVQDKKMGVMGRGEKQRQNTFTPQIEQKVTRSKTQRSLNRFQRGNDAALRGGQDVKTDIGALRRSQKEC